jgi:hypothetical protein
MNVSAEIDFIDFYYYSAAMGDSYWVFIMDLLVDIDNAEKETFQKNELHRRSAVLN